MQRVDTVVGETKGGQRVRILRWDDGLARQAREAVVVPWAYGPDCRPIAWSGRLRWLAEGTRGAVTGWLRPQEGWIAGLPTFDVEMAWREPVWAEGEPRWPEAVSDARRMTPEQFVELYSALPTVELLQGDPRSAAARMREWEGAHAELARLAPAATMACWCRTDPTQDPDGATTASYGSKVCTNRRTSGSTSPAYPVLTCI